MRPLAVSWDATVSPACTVDGAHTCMKTPFVSDELHDDACDGAVPTVVTVWFGSSGAGAGAGVGWPVLPPPLPLGSVWPGSGLVPGSGGTVAGGARYLSS